MEALHTRRKRTGWRNVSQFARATGAEIRQRLLCDLVEPARFGVALDLLVESSGLEFLKPSAESRELIRRQFGHRLFDIFERCHGHPRRLAEREGFEPPIRLPVCRISSAVHSTTLPPLHSIVIYHEIDHRPVKSGCRVEMLRL